MYKNVSRLGERYDHLSAAKIVRYGINVRVVLWDSNGRNGSLKPSERVKLSEYPFQRLIFGKIFDFR